MVLYGKENVMVTPSYRPDTIAESPTLPLPPPGPDLEAAAGNRLQPQTGAIGRAAAPDHIAPVTREDIARNHLALTALPAHLQDIEKFIPDLAGKKPGQAIKLIGARYSADPSPANAAILQHAINRITTTGAPDAQLKREIDAAVRLLHKRTEEIPPRGDDIFMWAYYHANFGGASMFADLPQGWVYWAIPYVGNAMNDEISSLIFSATRDEVAANVCLFEHAGFVGRYQNYSLTVPRGLNGYVEEEVSYVGDAFNDITSSILVVRRFANETTPVSVGALVPQSSIIDIINQQDSISPDGTPVFTWDLWPTGGSGSDWHPNDPSKMFLYVNIPISVNTHSIFGHYYAQVRYWIYIYVDSAGKLQGYVDWYGCYVEGGWITGRVKDGLMARIPDTIAQVNALVAQALALANIGGPYRFMYYLPGTNAFSGNTADDVSVVAVR
jgi:hypothetical protein